MQRLKAILSSAVCALAMLGATPAFAREFLSGYVCSVQVHKLTSQIHWYTKLNDAEQAAKEQGKLIVWINMVGKIDGAT